MTAIGIDLGTTNSSIARLVDGRPQPIPIDGNPLVPSVVLFQPGGRVMVGREARNLELAHPGAAIRSVKRRMGQEHRYQVDGRELTPSEVSAEILSALRREAEKATGELIREVVITVPAYFDDAQRRATLRAGELAGLDVLRLLNEPTSASLVYDQVGVPAVARTAPEIVMIYDLGGGTFDVSLLEVFEGVREVRATAGNTHLGGDDFDEILVRLLLDELRRRGVDPAGDLRAQIRLRSLAEEAKIALSRELETRVREEFICQDDRGAPVHLDTTITRRELEDRIRPLLESTIELCRRAVDEAHLEGQTLDRICLVGGSTRIPLVRELLARAFSAPVHEEIDPDLAVALGAAMQSGLLAGEPIERILVDVTAHSLGIRVLGELEEVDEGGNPDAFAPILRRNTVLPSARTEEFYTIVDGQEQIQVEVFQGEAARVSQNQRVGAFRFPLQPGPEGTPIRVEIAYDLSGMVRVSASQPGTGNARSVTLALPDAGALVQTPVAATSATPVERKAVALLGGLEGEAHAKLEALLERYRAASGTERERAEEGLLDFFLDAED